MAKLAHKLIDWLSDYGLELAIIGLPVLFGLGQLLLSEDLWQLIKTSEPGIRFWRGFGLWLSIATGLGFIPFAVAHIRHTKSMAGLEARLETEQQKTLALQNELDSLGQQMLLWGDGLLLSLADKLAFGRKDLNTERITVYYHDDKQGCFIPFARFSHNTVFKKKGRDYYPENKGCLGKAWQHGMFFINDLPDYNERKSAYTKQCKAYDLTPQDVKMLKMKSRLYFGWRVVDTRGANHLAVVVVESTDHERWTKDELVEFFQKEDRSLRETFERLMPWIPQLSQARIAGF